MLEWGSWVSYGAQPAAQPSHDHSWHGGAQRFSNGLWLPRATLCYVPKQELFPERNSRKRETWLLTPVS